MDALDYKIMEFLTSNGRVTWSDLAGKFEMSGPAIADRVRRLEEQGIIKGYMAILDPELLGYEMTAFIAISIDRLEHREIFLTRVNELIEVQECHHIAGEDDYILKVRCRGTKDLERIISQQLRTLPGVTKTRTNIVLNTTKDTHKFPLANGF